MPTMTITVKFLPATNTQPARMRAHSWLFPKGVVVNYSAAVGSEIHPAATHAAHVMLEQINAKTAADGVEWVLCDYCQTYDGSRLFTLGMK